MERASIRDRHGSGRAMPNDDKAQREVETVTAPIETQIAIDANGKMLRKRTVEEETKWRTAHGIDDELRGKHEVEAKRKRQPLERGEGRRREERKRQRVERQMLARPLLKGVMVTTKESE